MLEVLFGSILISNSLILAVSRSRVRRWFPLSLKYKPIDNPENVMLILKAHVTLENRPKANFRSANERWPANACRAMAAWWKQKPNNTHPARKFPWRRIRLKMCPQNQRENFVLASPSRAFLGSSLRFLRSAMRIESYRLKPLITMVFYGILDLTRQVAIFQRLAIQFACAACPQHAPCGRRPSCGNAQCRGAAKWCFHPYAPARPPGPCAFASECHPLAPERRALTPGIVACGSGASAGDSWKREGQFR